MAWVGPSRGLPAETCQENWGSYCSCFQEMVCSASQLMASVPGAWYYKAGLAPVHASDCWHLYPCRVLGHCSLCWARQCMLVVWSSFLNKMIKRTENNIKLLSKYFCLGHQQPHTNWREPRRTQIRVTLSPWGQAHNEQAAQRCCPDSPETHLGKVLSNLLWSYIWPWLEYKVGLENLLSSLPTWIILWTSHHFHIPFNIFCLINVMG